MRLFLAEACILRMPFLSDDALNGLCAVVNTADIFFLCNAEPDTWTEANATFRIGSKATPSMSTVDGTVSGRTSRMAAFADGSVESTDTASHWALGVTGTTTLHAAGALSGTQAVTSGNPFSMAQLDAVNVPDAA